MGLAVGAALGAYAAASFEDDEGGSCGDPMRANLQSRGIVTAALRVVDWELRSAWGLTR